MSSQCFKRSRLGLGVFASLPEAFLFLLRRPLPLSLCLPPCWLLCLPLPFDSLLVSVLVSEAAFSSSLVSVSLDVGYRVHLFLLLSPLVYLLDD